jgi:hypothetical protein
VNEHLEIVEHTRLAPSEQPWHVRIVAGNGETTWSTETFHRESSARDSILALGRMFSPVNKATVNEHELWVWLDEDELGAKLVVPIRQYLESTDEDDDDEPNVGAVEL